MEKEEIKREKGERNQEIVKTILEKIQRKEKEEKQKMNQNTTVRKVTTENFPKYLYGKTKGKDRCLIARQKCGNELKGNQHWREIEDKTCRICKNGEESLMHVLRECQATRSNIQIQFLRNERKGLNVMRRIEQERRKKQGIKLVRSALHYY